MRTAVVWFGSVNAVKSKISTVCMQNKFCVEEIGNKLVAIRRQRVTRKSDFYFLFLFFCCCDSIDSFIFIIFFIFFFFRFLLMHCCFAATGKVKLQNFLRLSLILFRYEFDATRAKCNLKK